MSLSLAEDLRSSARTNARCPSAVHCRQWLTESPRGRSLDHGRAETQVVDIPHVAEDLVDVAEVGRRASSRVPSTLSAVVNETRTGAIGARRRAHDQDGGEVVADVMGMGRCRGRLGRMAPKPSVDQSWTARRTLGRGHLLPDRRVHRLDQGRLRDARVDADRHSFWAKEAGLIPPPWPPGPARCWIRSCRSLRRDGISVLEGRRAASEGGPCGPLTIINDRL